MTPSTQKKLIRRSCIYCRVEFETFDTRKIYHSKECKEREREKRRRRTVKYKEYQRKYQANWRKKNPEKAKEIRDKHQKSEKREEYLRNWRKEGKQKEIIKRYLKSDISEVRS